MKFSLTSLAAAAVMLLGGASAQAAVYDLNISGTYDTAGNVVMGMQGSAVPFSYTLRLDTSLAADPVYLAAGNFTNHDWYGYSSDAIVSSSLSFGNQSWDVNNILDVAPLGQHGIYDSAHIWLNNQIGQNPNSAYMTIAKFTGAEFYQLQIGKLNISQSGTSLENGSTLTESVDFENNVFVYANSNNISITPVIVPSPVPEAEQYLMLAGGLMALGLRLRRRKAA